MKKALRKTPLKELFWVKNGEERAGANPDMMGDCSGLEGDCSGLEGRCSGLEGSIDDCKLTQADRRRTVDLSEVTDE